MFKVRKTNRAEREQYKLNLEIPKSNQVSFSTKSLRIQGPGIWNILPFRIKSNQNVQAFTDVIKFWDKSKYSYNISFDANIC